MKNLYSFEKFNEASSYKKLYYIKWSSWFDENKYDIDLMKSILEKVPGVEDIHTENQFGYTNQPEVLVFRTDDKKAVEIALEAALGTEWIIVSPKDWKNKKKEEKA